MAGKVEQIRTKQKRVHILTSLFLEMPLWTANRISWYSALFVAGAAGVYVLATHPEILANLTFHKIPLLNDITPNTLGAQRFVEPASHLSTYVGPALYTGGALVASAVTWGGLGLTQKALDRYDKGVDEKLITTIETK